MCIIPHSNLLPYGDKGRYASAFSPFLIYTFGSIAVSHNYSNNSCKWKTRNNTFMCVHVCVCVCLSVTCTVHFQLFFLVLRAI